MICTCTMNPSLDYYMEFESNPQDASVNRSSLEYYEAGGKGINVSIILNNLGVPSRALGFVGGFSKDFYISLLAKYEHIRPNFTYIDGHTRINVKMRTPGHGEVDLNATGPYITSENMNNLMGKVSTLYEQDYFVLAGNIPDYLIDRTKKMVGELLDQNIKVVLDTNVELMKDLIAEKPFMYKTTPDELAKIVGKKKLDDDGVIEAARQLHHDGVKHVLVVLDNHYALMVCEQGTYQCDFLQQGQAIDTVGTGDSMVAGFLMDYMRTRDAVDAFQFGASCGAATAYSKGLATREKIDALYSETKIQKIEE